MEKDLIHSTSNPSDGHPDIAASLFTLTPYPKLKREVEFLRDEMIGSRNPKSLEKDNGEEGCEGCTAKAQELEKLEGQICEKEFLIDSAIEEARADQNERNQLAAKLENLSKDMTKNAELLEALVDVRKTNEETENKLMCAMSQLDNERREMKSLSAAKMNQNAIIEELLDSLKSLQQDVNEKEEVISLLMKRSNNDRKEKEELFQQLAHAKSKRKVAEVEKDRWKRLAEERARNMVPAGRDPRTRRSLGSKSELDKLSEIQRCHNEQVHGLRSAYMTKLESLQRVLRDYEEKVTLLEARILVHSAGTSKRKPMYNERNSSGKKARESGNCHDLLELLQSVVPEADAMQLEMQLGSEIQEVSMSPAALKDLIQQWLQVVKVHHAQHLEKRRAREMDAFERQLRLKDERLESFRRQLLSMESEFSQRKSDLEELNTKLDMAVEEKRRAERAVELKEKEVHVLLKSMLQRNNWASPGPGPEAMDLDLDQLSHHDAQQSVLIFLQKELNDAKRKVEEVEAEHQKTLLKVTEDMEEELKLKDHLLAVAEAKLCQLRIQIDNKKRVAPTRTPAAFDPAVVPDKVYTIAVIGSQEVEVKSAISTACSEVEKLASKIAEVRKQMTESDENHDSSGLEELMDQIKAVSNSGKKLSFLRHAISIEELNNTKSILFKDFQATPVQQEETAMEQETLSLDQPRKHTEEPSTSGTNSGAPEASEEGIFSVDAESEVNSERQQHDVDAALPLPMEATDSEMEEIVEEDGEGTDLRTTIERKRARRKTLKEYFLDSPPETTVNQLPLPAMELQDPCKDPPVLSLSRVGVLHNIENNTLAATASSSPSSPHGNVAPKSPPLFSTPLFDRIKSRRREFNKTREDIHVLGLALEVRKIEEQLFQIDRGCASQPPDVMGTPKIGSSSSMIPKISPGRLNKRYTALTGKVGHFAKQMGLTSTEKQTEIVTDNPLFNKATPVAEVASLQRRADLVAQSLASIEAQGVDPPAAAAGSSKERLVDTVKTHLSLVQRSLNARTAPLTSRPSPAFGLTTSPLKARM